MFKTWSRRRIDHRYANDMQEKSRMFHRRHNMIAAATLLVVALVPITMWAQNSDLPLKAGQDRA